MQAGAAGGRRGAHCTCAPGRQPLRRGNEYGRILLNEPLPVREDIERSQPPHPFRRTRLGYDKMQHLIDRGPPRGLGEQTTRWGGGVGWGTETDWATLQHQFASAQDSRAFSFSFFNPPSNRSEGRSHELAAHPIVRAGLKGKSRAGAPDQRGGGGGEGPRRTIKSCLCTGKALPSAGAEPGSSAISLQGGKSSPFCFCCSKRG